MSPVLIVFILLSVISIHAAEVRTNFKNIWLLSADTWSLEKSTVMSPNKITEEQKSEIEKIFGFYNKGLSYSKQSIFIEVNRTFKKTGEIYFQIGWNYSDQKEFISPTGPNYNSLGRAKVISNDKKIIIDVMPFVYQKLPYWKESDRNDENYFSNKSEEEFAVSKYLTIYDVVNEPNGTYYETAMKINSANIWLFNPKRSEGNSERKLSINSLVEKCSFFTIQPSIFESEDGKKYFVNDESFLNDVKDKDFKVLKQERDTTGVIIPLKFENGYMYYYQIFEFNFLNQSTRELYESDFLKILKNEPRAIRRVDFKYLFDKNGSVELSLQMLPSNVFKGFLSSNNCENWKDSIVPKDISPKEFINKLERKYDKASISSEVKEYILKLKTDSKDAIWN